MGQDYNSCVFTFILELLLCHLALLQLQSRKQFRALQPSGTAGAKGAGEPVLGTFPGVTQGSVLFIIRT